MAVVLKSVKYGDITIDTHCIIGVMGYYYDEFLKSLQGEDVFYLDDKNFKDKNSVSDYITNTDYVNYLKELKLNEDFLNKKIFELSHSEKKLLKYLIMLSVNASIIIINEPFINLDYHYKKLLISLFNRLVKYKTIIIGSRNSNIIYELCKKVLLLGKSDYTYKDSVILSNKKVLKKYRLVMPEIIEFVRLANNKKNHLPYSKDIRDLIKDVYRNVTK